MSNQNIQQNQEENVVKTGNDRRNVINQNESQTDSTKPQEQGRSMIEMLGTLAIIGVLSIGGVVGYKAAFESYKTNEVLAFLNRTTVLTHVKALRNPLTETIIQDTIDELNSNYVATAVMCSSGYAINIEDLSQGVCQKLANLADDTYYIDSLGMYIGNECTPEAIACSSEDSNVVSFIFDETTSSDANDDSDLDDETGFYWCENNSVQKDGNKIATCQCLDSDEEVQYISDTDAINALCLEQEYYCSQGSRLHLKGVTSVVTECRCFYEGTGFYNTDEEAIAGMCTDAGGGTYYCTDYYGLQRVGFGTIYHDCLCVTNSQMVYDTDEAAVAAMCRRKYYCSSGELNYYNGLSYSTITTQCDCASSYAYYGSDEEAITGMCKTGKNCRCSGYTSGVVGIICGNSSTDSHWATTNCNCTGSGYFSSDEAAIAAMCRSGNGYNYRCDSNLNLWREISSGSWTGVFGTCHCVTGLNTGYFSSDSEAISAMCKTKSYSCSFNGNRLDRNELNGNVTVYEGCICKTGGGYYNSDEEAIAAICQATYYYCSDAGGASSARIYTNSGVVTYCHCNNKESYYASDEEAIAAMCNRTLNNYRCGYNGTNLDRKVGEYWSSVYWSCNCVSSTATGSYASDEEAIAAMCQN